MKSLFLFKIKIFHSNLGTQIKDGLFQDNPKVESDQSFSYKLLEYRDLK